MQLATVTIIDPNPGNPRGWRIINKSAFDPEQHQLYSETGATARPQIVNPDLSAVDAPTADAMVGTMTRTKVHRMNRPELEASLQAMNLDASGPVGALRDRLIAALDI